MANQRDEPVVNQIKGAKNVAVANHIGAIHNYSKGASLPAPVVPAPREHPPRRLPGRNDKFAGRLRELREIHEQLTHSDKVGVTQQTAAHGHGGVGKTAVATEYAWTHLDHYPGGLFWFNCAEGVLLAQVAELADPLGMVGPDDEKTDATAARIKHALETGQRALLILDNVHDAAQYTDSEWGRWLPGGKCCRLITTRCEHLPGVSMYRVERLTTDEGVELLANYRSDAKGLELVRDLVEWFDGLAVGLTVVGVYMSLSKNQGISWEGFVADLNSKGLGTVRAAEGVAGTLADYDKRVDAVFDELLNDLEPGEARALEYAALLPEDQIVEHWLTWLLDQDKTLDLPSAPGHASGGAAAVADLQARQLLRPARGEQTLLSLHRVLRRRLGERLKDDQGLTTFLLDSIAALAETRGEASHDALTDKPLRAELVPLLALSRELEARGRLTTAVSLTNWLCTPLTALGRYGENLASLERFLQNEQQPLATIGAQQSATLLSNLALSLRDMGEFPEARRLMEQAIAIDEKHFEPDHPALATSYSNLAMILKTLGDLADARRRMEQAIAIDEKHFEPDHPTLATRYSNLATILKDLGELADARQRMEQAITIWEKHFKDHPMLALSYNNLAWIELADGHKPQACELWRRAHAIVTKHFDSDHPHVRITEDALRRHCGDGCPPADAKP